MVQHAPQHQVANTRPIANGKAAGPDERPAELLKLFFDDPFGSFTACIIITMWRTGEVPQQ